MLNFLLRPFLSWFNFPKNLTKGIHLNPRKFHELICLYITEFSTRFLEILRSIAKDPLLTEFNYPTLPRKKPCQVNSEGSTP
jgi:hypothetical protein